MRRGIRNPCGLKLRRYNVCMIVLNTHLSFLPEAKASAIFLKTELNKILLNCMLNRWSSQAYLQGFDCETITFKNM